jgi:hypothetical protein
MKRIFICLIVFVSSYALSQWSTNPYENLQVAEHGGNIHVASDGNGGAIVTFNNFADVVKGYMQMIDKYGYLKWNEPMVILDGPGLKSYVIDIFRNPDGTILIGHRSGYTYVDPIPRFEYDPYVQKIDSNGNKLWGENGIRLRADSTGKEISGIDFCYDGDGGLYAVWNFHYEVSYPPYFYDSLFIQHISKNGDRLWGENGIFIDDSIFSTLNSWIIEDDGGGIYVQYRKKNTEHYIRKYDPSGNLIWTLINSLSYPSVISDNQGGIILSGVKIVFPRQLIINRISLEGERLWGEGGIIVDDSVGANYAYAKLLLNSDSTVSVLWDTEWWPNDDVFLQRYTLDGEQVWAEPIRVSDIISAKSRLGLINSNSNSNIVAWAEGLDSSAQFAHKINSDGIKLWNEKKLISTNYSTDETKVLTNDNDGAIIVWRIDPPWGGIYAQQISKYGNLGEVITSIKEDENNTKHNDFNLTQNYPNPFNPTTTIRFEIPERSIVTIKVYDVLGSEVATLINEEKAIGNYEVEFNGNILTSGIYFYQFTAGSFSETKKMILLR